MTTVYSLLIKSLSTLFEFSDNMGSYLTGHLAQTQVVTLNFTSNLWNNLKGHQTISFTNADKGV